MRCTAKNRSGAQCGHYAINGTSKCRYHGGASLVGVASKTFKHGRYSKDLPTRLAARYSEALADEKLIELRDEIALVDVRQGELLARLDSGLTLRHWRAAQRAHADMLVAMDAKDVPAMQQAINDLGAALTLGTNDGVQWAEIMDLTEQRRKLVESEQKRMALAQQMITAEQGMTLIARLVEIVRKNVNDQSVLDAIAAELRAVTNTGTSAGDQWA